MTPNLPSDEGRALGRELSRLCEAEESKRPFHKGRCGTCAFREGSYPNGSAATVMTAFKCAMERTPFLCHERADEPCAGWLLMRVPAGSEVQMPWEHPEGDGEVYGPAVPPLDTAP